MTVDASMVMVPRPKAYLANACTGNPHDDSPPATALTRSKDLPCGCACTQQPTTHHWTPQLLCCLPSSVLSPAAHACRNMERLLQAFSALRWCQRTSEDFGIPIGRQHLEPVQAELQAHLEEQEQHAQLAQLLQLLRVAEQPARSTAAQRAPNQATSQRRPCRDNAIAHACTTGVH